MYNQVSVWAASIVSSCIIYHLTSNRIDALHNVLTSMRMNRIQNCSGSSCVTFGVNILLTILMFVRFVIKCNRSRFTIALLEWSVRVLDLCDLKDTRFAMFNTYVYGVLWHTAVCFVQKCIRQLCHN